MTDSKKVDGHSENHDARDKPEPLVSADAHAARNAASREVVDASIGNNQNGSAWLDKSIPKPVDYKSIRLVDMGVVAQLSKAQRLAEELKPKSEQHITFNELLVLEKGGNLDARRLVNSIDDAYQCRDKETKRATLNTLQDVADKTFQRGQYAEVREAVDGLVRSEDRAFDLRTEAPIRQLNAAEEQRENGKPFGQKHLTVGELDTFAARGDKHALLMSKEIEAACNLHSHEQRNSILADVQNRADRYYRRGEYFIERASENKGAAGLIDQIKTVLSGAFGRNSTRQRASESKIEVGTEVAAKNVLQGHVEVNRTEIKQTFLNAANASLDSQAAGVGPAIVHGLGRAITDVAEGLAFGVNAAADGVKLVGQTLNYEFEDLTGKNSAAVSAQIGRETEAEWIKHYAEPAAKGVEKSLEPMTNDAEDIGFTGDYQRLATDPLKYAGQKFEEFSSQTIPQQVEQLTTFGAENFLNAELGKVAGKAAETAKDISSATGVSFGHALEILASPSFEAVTAEGTFDDSFNAMSKTKGIGDGSGAQRPKKAKSPESLSESSQPDQIAGELAGQIHYKIDKYTGRPQRTDLGRPRQPYKWDTINEHFSPDVIRQRFDHSCILASGEMITNGEFTEAILIEKLGSPSDIDSLAKALGDGWSSAAIRNLASISDIGKYGLWAAEVSQNSWPRVRPHVVVVDGVSPIGNIMIRDPFEGTKYEVEPNYFRKQFWTGRAVYRTKYR